MDVFEHFSCYTKLPILLDVVCEQVKESGRIDEFRIASVGIDKRHLLGMSRLIKENTPDGKVIAEVSYSSQIVSEPVRRIVCCKEILHALDPEDVSANSRDVVDSLIENIVMPPQIQGLTTQTSSDHIGMLKALMVLLPRDALSVLRPKYQQSSISVEQIAQLAKIPDAYARLALSPVWEEIVESIQ